MRRALIVGINDYPGAKLHGCVNDANAIASVLGTHGDGGPNFAVKLLTAPSNIIGRPELKGAIEKLFAGDCEICLFYFSGHGLIKSTGGYIVTQDARKYDEGVSMDEILALANQSKAKDKVILLDCCHSGALGSPTITGNSVALLSEGLSVLTASRDSESALEIDGKGVFTSLIVDALQGGAADLRGYVTPGSIYAYVDQALGPWDQRPIFKTNVSRFTSLRSIAPLWLLNRLERFALTFQPRNTKSDLIPLMNLRKK
jgi:Caspase domain